MTFAELIVLIAVGFFLCFLMFPIQKYLEIRIYKFFRFKSRKPEKPIIDITNDSKKVKRS